VGNYYPFEEPQDKLAGIISQKEASTANNMNYNSIFFHLSESETNNLVANCRAHGATVQAALSVASMIAYLIVQNVTLPVTVVSGCPINLRKFSEPPCDPADCVLAAGFLIWNQIVDNPDASIWNLVTEASQKIRYEIKTNSGFKYLKRIANLLPQPAICSVATSVGVNPIQSSYGKTVKVNNVQFMAGAYKPIPVPETFMFSHVHTFNNKYCHTFTYSQNYICDEWANQYAKIQETIIKSFTTSDENLNILSNFLA